MNLRLNVNDLAIQFREKCGAKIQVESAKVKLRNHVGRSLILFHLRDSATLRENSIIRLGKFN